MKKIKRRLFSVVIALAMMLTTITIPHINVYAASWVMDTLDPSTPIWFDTEYVEKRMEETTTKYVCNEHDIVASVSDGAFVVSGCVHVSLTDPNEEPDPEPDPDPGLSGDHDNHDNHNSGSNNDDSRPAPPSPHQSAQTEIFSSLDTQLAKIDASSNGQATIDGKDLVNALPSTTMQKIAENPNVTVFFTYIYNDAKYTTAIPAGTAIDSSVEWYGPIYMMTHFPTMWRQDDNTSVPVVAPVQ